MGVAEVQEELKCFLGKKVTVPDYTSHGVVTRACREVRVGGVGNAFHEAVIVQLTSPHTCDGVTGDFLYASGASSSWRPIPADLDLGIADIENMQRFTAENAERLYASDPHQSDYLVQCRDGKGIAVVCNMLTANQVMADFKFGFGMRHEMPPKVGYFSGESQWSHGRLRCIDYLPLGKTQMGVPKTLEELRAFVGKRVNIDVSPDGIPSEPDVGQWPGTGVITHALRDVRVEVNRSAALEALIVRLEAAFGHKGAKCEYLYARPRNPGIYLDHLRDGINLDFYRITEDHATDEDVFSYGMRGGVTSHASSGTANPPRSFSFSGSLKTIGG